jgi:hypothetical protein
MSRRTLFADEETLLESLDLSLWDVALGRFDALSFQRGLKCGQVRITVGGETYLAEMTAKASIAAPGMSPESAVSIFTGVCVGQPVGSVLMVVNCGNEPPTLQMSLGSLLNGTRSWSWRITHAVQHQILNFLASGE